MHTRTIEGRGRLWVDRGVARETAPLWRGLVIPAPFHPVLLVESDAEPDDGRPGRPWFPDYEEVE